MDITESGGEIGEKLFALLDVKQQQELIQYVLGSSKNTDPGIVLRSSPSPPDPKASSSQQLTERRVGELYFCLESRTVCISNREIDLTAKEFDIFAVLISNPYRVVTYAMIADMIWHELLDCYAKKTISNHVSSLRRKLKTASCAPDYIKSVHGIGYKFNSDTL